MKGDDTMNEALNNNRNEGTTMPNRDNSTFAANLALLRKGKGLSQEQLAEQLQVSRQSVSKWESGTCLPELATLDALCTLFGCTLDTLLRGSVQQQARGALDAYDAEGDALARSITVGVVAILAGVTLGCAMAARNMPENLYGFVMLLGVIAGVTVLVAGAIRHETFAKGCPAWSVEYPPERRAAFDRRFPGWMAGGIGLVLADVAMVALLADTFPEDWLGALFLAVLTVAVGLLVWGGAQKSKYDDPAEQRRMREDADYARRQGLMGRLIACLWILTVAAYLVWGFMADGWRQGWVVFVVAGLLSGVIAVALSRPGDD